jgi:crotonobetainyl-CoA:carnitine CoA-transferase CaiB-like acyl-CoA transferase
MYSPFAGRQVLEITASIAGAYCGKLFADAGADVVKCEPPGGDPLRRWSASGAAIAPGESSALFQFLNGHKRSVVPGPDVAPGTADLVRHADLIIVDGSGGWDPGSVSQLAASLPHAVIVSISPFGLTGPYAEAGLPATEFVLQAMCGSIGSRGFPEGLPLQAGGRIGEWVTGIYGAVAAAAVLRRASRGGPGELIDVSMFECMISTMGGLGAVSLGVLGPQGAPPGRSVEIPSIVATADGLVGFCTITGQQFRDFLVLIERPDLLDDPDLASMAGRARRRAEFQRMVDAWASRHTTAEIIELASAMRIPIAPIGSPANVTGIDHFREREVFVKNPAGFLQPRPPYRSPRLRMLEPGDAPAPGAHNGDLGWSARPATAAAGCDRARPLDGIRVLDFTAFWAGPAATQALAALGADVIKVEGLRRPDGMRFAGGKPPTEDLWWEWGSVFLSCNGDKRDLTLELSRPEARQIAFRLVAHSDLVIENFSPRVMANMGLDWDDVHVANPRAVMVRMPAFGLDGPWRDRVGFAQTMEQASGMAWLTGESNGPPLIPRGPCDPIAGLHAAFAAIAGLEVRDRTGSGMQIESTMVEAALNVAAEATVDYGAYSRAAVRNGNRGPGASPQGVYQCAGDDSWVALAVTDDAQWDRLTAVLGYPTALQGAAWEDVVAGSPSADLVDEVISQWTAGRGAAEAVGALRGAGIPAADVNGPAQLLADHQLAHRRFWETVAHSVAGEIQVPGMPFRFVSLDEPWTRSAPPTLGQHNHQILTAVVGLSDDEISELESKSVIGVRPAGM